MQTTILKIIKQQLPHLHCTIYHGHWPWMAVYPPPPQPPHQLCHIEVNDHKAIIYPDPALRFSNRPVRIPIAHPHLTKLIINTILNLSCAQHCTSPTSSPHSSQPPSGPNGAPSSQDSSPSTGGY